MTLGSHQRTVGQSQSWITPKWLLDAVGPFDLDPCAAIPQPWACAGKSYVENGLERPWIGRVWLNPPFERYNVGAWVERMAWHGNGIALLHARTEAAWFIPCWERAKAIFFLADRLHFHYPDGRRAEANSGAPVCLVAFSDRDVECLRTARISGYLVTSWEML